MGAYKNASLMPTGMQVLQQALTIDQPWTRPHMPGMHERILELLRKQALLTFSIILNKSHTQCTCPLLTLPLANLQRSPNTNLTQPPNKTCLPSLRPSPHVIRHYLCEQDLVTVPTPSASPRLSLATSPSRGCHWTIWDTIHCLGMSISALQFL